MTKPLSPAAQAVVDAWDAKLNPDPDGLTYLTHDPEHEALAAALEAVADQIMPITPEPAGSKPTAAWHRWNVTGALRLNILSIAAELEAMP